jgi:hypothetical protein
MNMLGGVVLLLAIAVAPLGAQEDTMHQLLVHALSHQLDQDHMSTASLYSKVNEETVGALSVTEVRELLPLGQKCVLSTDAEINAAGYAVFISVALRPDSGDLLEPYITDLGALLSSSAGGASAHHLAIFVLGNMQPKLPSKAID